MAKLSTPRGSRRRLILGGLGDALAAALASVAARKVLRRWRDDAEIVDPAKQERQEQMMQEMADMVDEWQRDEKPDEESE